MNTLLFIFIVLIIIAVGFAIAFFNVSGKLYEKELKNVVTKKCIFCKTNKHNNKGWVFKYNDTHNYCLRCLAEEVVNLRKLIKK